MKGEGTKVEGTGSVAITLHGVSSRENFTILTLLREQQKNPERCCAHNNKQTTTTINTFFLRTLYCLYLEGTSSYTQDKDVAELNSDPRS